MSASKPTYKVTFVFRGTPITSDIGLVEEAAALRLLAEFAERKSAYTIQTPNGFVCVRLEEVASISILQDG